MTCPRVRRNLTAFFLLVVLTRLAFAGGADIQVDAFVTAGPRELPLTTFPSNTPKLYVLFKTHGVKHGDKFRSVLIADHAGHIAAKSKQSEAEATLDGDTIDGGVSFTRPINNWPIGDYHVDIYINDQLVATTKFKIEAAP